MYPGKIALSMSAGLRLSAGALLRSLAMAFSLIDFFGDCSPLSFDYCPPYCFVRRFHAN